MRERGREMAKKEREGTDDASGDQSSLAHNSLLSRLGLIISFHHQILRLPAV